MSQSYEKAVELFEKGASQGDPNAMVCLGVMHEDGQGVEQSYTRAVALYRKAADMGLATAQYNLGCSYASGGQGVDQSYAMAQEWWTKAAAQGHQSALEYLIELNEQTAAGTLSTVAVESVKDTLRCSYCGSDGIAAANAAALMG